MCCAGRSAEQGTIGGAVRDWRGRGKEATLVADLSGRRVLVTGGASGIGAAWPGLRGGRGDRRHRDLDKAGAGAVAAEIGGIGAG